MSVQGVPLLRDHGVVSGVERQGFVPRDQVHLADDHLDGGLSRVLVFLEVLPPNQCDHGLLQLVVTAADKIVSGASAGRLAGLAQHVLGDAGQSVFFHTPFSQHLARCVTGTTRQLPGEVTP